MAAELQSGLADAEFKRYMMTPLFNWLDDVDHVFLDNVKEDRSDAMEAMWLGNAEYVFEHLALPQLRAVQQAVEKYGLHVRLIGG